MCNSNIAYIRDSAQKLIFACSGASDTGEIADRIARKLCDEGIGQMFCIAGIGAWIPLFLATADIAKEILVIDGCPIKCAKKTMEHSGFEEFDHICLADIGLEKGKTIVTEELIESVASMVKGLFIINHCERQEDLSLCAGVSILNNPLGSKN